ncbi:MAG: hypothetical protein KGZ50_09385 [Peptococcaceae bacterium]|nr:hypothetical protein [Peptococcaceae bacterium]
MRDVVHGTSGGVQIGTIETNDYFRFQSSWLRPNTWDPDWPWDLRVMIRNSAGVLQWGFVTSAVSWPQGFTPVENLFWGTDFWNGGLRTYPIQNRPAQLRNRDGVLIETLPVGSMVAIRTGIAAPMGQTWCAFWQVTAVLRPISLTAWGWQHADPVGSTWAFVDTGLPFNRPATSTIRTSLA